MNYKKAGVNILKGEKASNIAYYYSKKTFCFPEKFLRIPKTSNGFSAKAFVKYKKNFFLTKNSDGVGSKSVLAHQTGFYENLSFDLIAMIADDTAAIGGLPLIATNTLDMHKVRVSIVKKLFCSLPDACKEAGIAMVGGEIAELPDQLNKNCFTWNADLTGILDPKKSVFEKIKRHAFVIGLKSNGIRSNGLTLARKILEKAFGKNFYETSKGKKLAKKLLNKSKIYARPICSILGYFSEEKKRVSGLVHVTGSGLPGNLARVLEKNFYACIYDPFKPQKEFLKLQRIGNVSDKEAYNTWNMGTGFCIITLDPDPIIYSLKKQKIKAKIIGEIKKSASKNKKIELHGKALNSELLLF